MKAVMVMHEGAQIIVRRKQGYSKTFTVKVELHQGSVLTIESPTVSDSNGYDFK